LILAYFCLEDFENVDKCYRRFKKNLKDKTVTPDNDFIVQGIFLITKWRETQRNQYLKKIDSLFKDPTFENLDHSQKQLLEIMDYFQIPVTAK
jgi:transposase-like protein